MKEGYFAGKVLLLSCALLSIFMAKAAERISRNSSLSLKLCRAAMIFLLLVVLLFFLWLFGPYLLTQLSEMQLKISEAVQQIKDFLTQYTWGSTLLDLAPTSEQLAANLMNSVPSYLSDAAYLFFRRIKRCDDDACKEIPVYHGSNLSPVFGHTISNNTASGL